MPQGCSVNVAKYEPNSPLKDFSIVENFCGFKEGMTLPIFVNGLLSPVGRLVNDIHIELMSNRLPGVYYALPGQEGNVQKFTLESMEQTLLSKLLELPKRLEVKSLSVEFFGNSLGGHLLICLLKNKEKLKRAGIEVTGLNLFSPVFAPKRKELLRVVDVFKSSGMRGCISLANTTQFFSGNKNLVFDQSGNISDIDTKKGSSPDSFLPIQKFCDVMNIINKSIEGIGQLKNSKIPIRMYAAKDDELAGPIPKELRVGAVIEIERGGHFFLLKPAGERFRIDYIKRIKASKDAVTK